MTVGEPCLPVGMINGLCLDEDAEKEETAEYYHHLGDILFMINRPQEAVDAWKTALEATPDDELLKKKVKNRTFYYE